MRPEKNLLRVMGLFVLIAVLAVVSIYMDAEQLFSPSRLRQLASTNLWEAAGLFFIAGMAVKFLFLPVSPLSFVAGFIFGAYPGFFIALFTLLVSSLAAFGLARWLGRDWVRSIIDEEQRHVRFVEDLLERHGLLAVVVLRVVPALPISGVNMGLGLSAVRTRDFVLGSILGLLPGTFLLAQIGSASLEPWSARFWIFVALFAALVLGGVLAARYMRRKG